MTLLHQYHFTKPSKSLLVSNDKKIVKFSEEFDVIKLSLSKIRVLKETCGFRLGDQPICEEIVQFAKQTHEADLSYPIIPCPEGRLMAIMSCS